MSDSAFSGVLRDIAPYAILGVAGVLIYNKFFKNPADTGAAVQGATETATKNVVSTVVESAKGAAGGVLLGVEGSISPQPQTDYGKSFLDAMREAFGAGYGQGFAARATEDYYKDQAAKTAITPATSSNFTSASSAKQQAINVSLGSLPTNAFLSAPQQSQSVYIPPTSSSSNVVKSQITKQENITLSGGVKATRITGTDAQGRTYTRIIEK